MSVGGMSVGIAVPSQDEYAQAVSRGNSPFWYEYGQTVGGIGERPNTYLKDSISAAPLPSVSLASAFLRKSAILLSGEITFSISTPSCFMRRTSAMVKVPIAICACISPIICCCFYRKVVNVLYIAMYGQTVRAEVMRPSQDEYGQTVC